jgi:hypothetical protein
MNSTFNTEMKPAMKIVFRQPAPLLAVILTLMLPALPGRAINIDFDSGYSPTGGTGGVGNLVGQPSTGTIWTGGGATGTVGAILITANDGTTGKDQAARTQAGSATVKYASCSFTPSDADLGGAFDQASSVVNYSFQLKLNGAPNKGTSVALRLYIGGIKGAHFDLLTNGVFVVTAGKGDGKAIQPVYAKTEGGTEIFLATANTYFTVSGTLNYATKTFTASVNNVSQSVNHSPDFGFFDNGANTAEADIINVRCFDPNWISVSIDNVKLAAASTPTSSAIPAPSSPGKP